MLAQYDWKDPNRVLVTRDADHRLHRRGAWEHLICARTLLTNLQTAWTRSLKVCRSRAG